MIYSGYEDYTSYGLAVDIAGSYINPEHNLTVSLTARNIGTQLKPFVSRNIESLPLEINLGVTQKLKHLPFRYSIILTNLHKWDLTYYDPPTTQTIKLTPPLPASHKKRRFRNLPG